MNNSWVSNQLIDLLATFNREEKRGFRQFLRAKLHNQRPELLELLDYLWDYRSSKVKKALKLRQLREVRAQGKASKWRLLNSDLLRKAESYLSIHQDSPLLSTEKNILLIDMLHERKQPQRVAAAQRRLKRALERLPAGVEKERLRYRANWTITRQSLRNRSLSASAANDVLEDHQRCCMLESLQLACEVLANRTVNQGELQQGLLPFYLQYIESSNLLKSDSLLALYYYCYQTLADADNQIAFEQLSRRITDLGDLKRQEAADILQVAVNACIRRVNSGQLQYCTVALDLYEKGLENAYLLDAKEEISRILFSNFVALALKSDSNHRAREFVDRYASFLPREVAQSTAALNRARLAYASGNLSQAMEQLRSARDEDLLTTLNIRILQMRLYYELGELRLLDAHLDSLSTFLRRRKNSLDYHYQAYRKLVYYAGKLRRLNPYDKVALAAFRSAVEEEERLPERAWLLRVSIHSNNQ